MQLQRSRIKVLHHSVGWPRAFRWHGSVLPRVAIPVLVLSVWATFVAVVQTSQSTFFWPPSTIFLSIISFVLSLLLGFRTNTAYERYWEGRRLWSNLTIATRNISRIIWIAADSQPQRDNDTEKTTALGLLLSFLIAVRNHARGDHGLVLPDGSLRREFNGLLPPNVHLSTSHPYLLTQSKLVHADILYLLNAYVDDLFRRKCLDAPQCVQLINIINGMNETVTSIERILTTPIPLAYNCHLKQIMYMYLILLPFQLISDHKFISILITALATFTFVGVELIGSEIENPFGMDANDLPIDEFIADLEVELGEIISTRRSGLVDWALDDGTAEGIYLDISNSDKSKDGDGRGSSTLRSVPPTSLETKNTDVTSIPVQNHSSLSSSGMGLVTILGITAIGHRVVHSGNMSLTTESPGGDAIVAAIGNGSAANDDVGVSDGRD